MAKYFSQNDIDEFRECFFLYGKGDVVTRVEDLTLIMRSLGFSPTVEELNKYYEEKEGRIEFASFLDIMHKHSDTEKCQEEIITAFRAHDASGKGAVPGPELTHILTKCGEKLTSAEVERLYKEAGVSARGSVKGQDIMKVVLTPIPDY